MKKLTFGSGYFGEWIEDEFGLPAYCYTCNQENDPKAITQMNKEWRLNTEHLHQVGNDRLVAVASNYGYIQVRQDEGGPKYLNEFDPDHGFYAGGFGYLTDGTEFISTYYPGNADLFERIFGIGYLRKKVKGHGFIIDQTVFAPYGDDPVILSFIKITNSKEFPVNLRWVEYWGCNMYQFSVRAYAALMGGNQEDHPRKLRQKFTKDFSNTFKIIGDNIGLQNEKYYQDKTKEYNLNSLKPTFDDYFPPKTFLISLDAKADVITDNASKFFGKGGVNSPEKLKSGLISEINSLSQNPALLIQRNFHLEPGESRNLTFMYGYLPDGFKIESLIAKYSKETEHLFLESCEKWKQNRIELDIIDEPWVAREIFWHNYYLRAAMTYDDFFKEHILSQGHVYQYIIGFQGAARDPLQHALPFVFIEPDIVKNVLRYTLKSTRKNGEIPYGITGSGQILPVPYRPSDQQLWLLWLTSEYILATRDNDFLDEIITRHPIYTSGAEKVTVREILNRCFNYLVKKIGTGKHGLLRLSNGDWNDVVVIGHISEDQHVEIQKVAESVLNSAMAIYALKIYSDMLYYIGDKESAKEVLKFSNGQREAVQAQWVGNWLRRAWLTEDLGWIGEDQMWLEPQPWAIIGDALNQEEKDLLIKSINTLVRKPSKIGAMILSKGLKTIRRLGEGTNAGIWPSINGTLIWALSLVDRELGFEEWKKNSLAYHAENYPEIWYGIWSGPDTINSELSKYPGQTIFRAFEQIDGDKRSNDEENLGHIGLDWTDFPVFNLHPHAWPLYNTKHLMGISFTIEGLEINPKFPKNKYRFSSRIVGLERNSGFYKGFYSPIREGYYVIKIFLDTKELNQIEKVIVNGTQEEFEIAKNSIQFKGKGSFNQPLSWKIYM